MYIQTKMINTFKLDSLNLSLVPFKEQKVSKPLYNRLRHVCLYSITRKCVPLYRVSSFTSINISSLAFTFTLS